MALLTALPHHKCISTDENTEIHFLSIKNFIYLNIKKLLVTTKVPSLVLLLIARITDGIFFLSLIVTISKLVLYIG